MKVEINKTEEKQEIKYPCLMKHLNSDLVVLFNNHYCGMVVVETNNNEFDKIGKYYEEWIIDSFTPFKGSITLSND